ERLKLGAALEELLHRVLVGDHDRRAVQQQEAQRAGREFGVLRRLLGLLRLQLRLEDGAEVVEQVVGGDGVVFAALEGLFGPFLRPSGPWKSARDTGRLVRMTLNAQLFCRLSARTNRVISSTPSPKFRVNVSGLKPMRDSNACWPRVEMRSRSMWIESTV